MKYELIIKPEAELDLLQSAKWYENQQKNLGHRFMGAVEDKLKAIQKNPLHYQVRYKNVRLALVKRFPFAIHYITENEKVFVIAVLSTYRNPKIWEE